MVERASPAARPAGGDPDGDVDARAAPGGPGWPAAHVGTGAAASWGRPGRPGRGCGSGQATWRRWLATPPRLRRPGRGGQPSSVVRWTSSSRPNSVRRALAWAMRSPPGPRLQQPKPTEGTLNCQQPSQELQLGRRSPRAYRMATSLTGRSTRSHAGMASDRGVRPSCWPVWGAARQTAAGTPAPSTRPTCPAPYCRRRGTRRGFRRGRTGIPRGRGRPHGCRSRSGRPTACAGPRSPRLRPSQQAAISESAGTAVGSHPAHGQGARSPHTSRPRPGPPSAGPARPRSAR
jgi:hypothetical protein